jgi:hypothetical protein
VPRALDRDGESTLALGREARLAPWFNLAALGDEAAQAGDILVVDVVHAIGREDIDAPPSTGTGATEATATATAEAATAATATAEATTAATAAAEATTATITFATAIVGSRRAIIAGRAIARCAGGALLINHGSFLLQSSTAYPRA